MFKNVQKMHTNANIDKNGILSDSFQCKTEMTFFKVIFLIQMTFLACIYVLHTWSFVQGAKHPLLDYLSFIELSVVGFIAHIRKSLIMLIETWKFFAYMRRNSLK